MTPLPPTDLADLLAGFGVELDPPPHWPDGTRLVVTIAGTGAYFGRALVELRAGRLVLLKVLEDGGPITRRGDYRLSVMLPADEFQPPDIRPALARCTGAPRLDRGRGIP